jgi:glycolate oxidase
VTFGQQLAAKHGVRVACFGHAGDGNIHVNLLVDLDPDEPEKSQHHAAEALDELFAQVLSWGGAITGEHGIGLAKQKWWPEAVSPAVRLWHQRIKAEFDPNGILNPGKWLHDPE